MIEICLMFLFSILLFPFLVKIFSIKYRGRNKRFVLPLSYFLFILIMGTSAFLFVFKYRDLSEGYEIIFWIGPFVWTSPLYPIYKIVTLIKERYGISLSLFILSLGNDRNPDCDHYCYSVFGPFVGYLVCGCLFYYFIGKLWDYFQGRIKRGEKNIMKTQGKKILNKKKTFVKTEDEIK